MPTKIAEVNRLSCLVLLLLVGTWATSDAQPSADSGALKLDSILEAARIKYDLPAMGAAIILDGKLTQVVVRGVRKYGDTTHATVMDTWHIGSDTKSMTATLVARLIELGKLKWDSKIVDVFPEFKGKINAQFESVTLEMLLCHRSGLSGESWPEGITFDSMLNFPGTPREQRYLYTRLMLSQPPEATAGTKYIYANAGFAIAGAMAERVMNERYEDLMMRYVFKPLGITSVGYGSMNTPGLVDEPWQHTVDSGTHTPIDGGPRSDNPEAITPAGRVHLALADWAKYAISHLVGEERGGILKPATFKHLHSLPFGPPYGFGWGILERKWSKGTALAHDGSNAQNYASIWLAPNLKFGLLVVTNQGGDEAGNAVQQVVNQIVKKLWVKL